MKKNWERWEPISGLKDKYNIDSVEDTLMDGFKITLSECCDKGKRVAVTFKNGIFAHRETHEIFRLATYKLLDDNYGKDFYEKWTFFKVTNSSYLKWLSEQSYTLSDVYSVTHYSFLAGNVMLDIAHVNEPTVEFID